MCVCVCQCDSVCECLCVFVHVIYACVSNSSCFSSNNSLYNNLHRNKFVKRKRLRDERNAIAFAFARGHIVQSKTIFPFSCFGSVSRHFVVDHHRLAYIE